MVNFNRSEEQQLEGLLPALRQGLDPTQAYGIFSGVQDSALARMAEARAMRQQMFMQASDQVRELGMSGVPQSGAMDLINSYQSQMPGLGKGKYQGRLEDLVTGGVYEGPGQTSSLYQAPPEEAPAEAGGIAGGDLAEIQAQATAAAMRQQQERGTLDPMQAAQLAELGPGPSSLHDLRMQQMSIARMLGLPEEHLAAIYDMLGQQFQAAGGDPGMAPLSGYGSV